MQGGGAAVDGDGMGCADFGGNAVFEFRQSRTQADMPGTQDINHRFYFAFGNVRPGQLD